MGGGGGAARVVPGHSGKDWAAEIGNRDVRMKEETQPSQGNTGNHGGGVFASGRNRACEPKKAPKHPRCQRKIEGEPKKSFANLWSRQRITKKAHAGRGLETIWEINQYEKRTQLQRNEPPPILADQRGMCRLCNVPEPRQRAVICRAKYQHPGKFDPARDTQ